MLGRAVIIVKDIMKSGHFLLATLCFLQTIWQGLCSDDEERLIIQLFNGYNHLIRPVEHSNKSTISIQFSLAMVLLINVDEKNQIMQTNVWLTIKWFDYQMVWKPQEYGKISTIRVPPDKVWLPDIVLFNNADGNYEVSFQSNVVIEHTGQMLWVPPAIYKSSCTIEVAFFPFDEQTCAMIFGSWTFGQDEVQLAYLDGKDQVELNDYSYSGIWDIMEVPGALRDLNSKIVYHIRIRRKTLFYTVILIIPTVLMAFLSMMVFYLPADASEKITLAISILLALVVFLLLVSKILPPTSSTIPLMAKYLLLTFVMNIITILVTVIIINVYFRGPTTHVMAPWVSLVFLGLLPRLLLMKRPVAPRPPAPNPKANGRPIDPLLELDRNVLMTNISGRPETVELRSFHHPNCSLRQNMTAHPVARTEPDNSDMDEIDFADLHIRHLSPDAFKAIEAIEYITEHLKQDDEYKKVRDDWKYVAMVIDRLLLYVFFGVTVGGTLLILLSAPNVFEYVDQEELDETYTGLASDDEERLFIDLFRGYQPLVRPVRSINDSAIVVQMGLQLVLLISIDEKNQVMQTNVWLTLTWNDYQLTWDEREYGTKQIRLPADKVWSPDIVLFNNADGNYEVSYYSNVLVDSDGMVQWVPPAIYKSSCVIDVTFFPFDEQYCHMIFGSWTYDRREVVLDFKGGVQAMDLTDFYKSSIWDVVDCPGEKTQERDRIDYTLVLRRKTLFYTVVLIIPTVLMAFLSMMVFYLPTDAGEKMTLVISILLSLNVFLLLVSKILPPTSLIIPLMAKYLLLTFLLNVITILVTVMIVNVYYRGPTTHNMPRWIRLVFLSFFARVLLMRRPKPPGHRRRNRATGCNGTLNKKTNNNSPARTDPLASFQLPLAHPEAIQHHPYCRSSRATLRRAPAIDIELVDADDAELPPRPLLSADAIKAVEAIEFIAQHLKDDQQYKKVRDDWKYVAMVIDRLLLYIFFGVTLGGTLGILFSATNIFDWVDQVKVLEELKVKYRMGSINLPPGIV